MDCILHNKSVQKQIQISRYQKLSMSGKLYQSNDQQYKTSLAYTEDETRFIFKVFWSCNLKAAFKASVTLQKHLCQEQLLTKDKTKIYKLNCHDCMGCYNGQTQHSFKVEYNKYTHAICDNNEKSGHSQHIWNTPHSCCALQNTSHILDTQHKGLFL
jgi:hypothetical protein